MTSKSAEKKILRKQKRCQHLISEETKIECTDQVTPFLVVCNAGLSTGLCQETLLNHAQELGEISDIIMPPGKSYCFVKCLNEQNSLAIYNGMHGKACLAQNNGIVYLSFSKDVPIMENPWSQTLPSGLHLLPDFITEIEEQKLLDSINWNEDDDDDANNEDENCKNLKHRQVKHFGYEFLYGTNMVDVEKPLKRQIPTECNILWPRLQEAVPNLKFPKADQLTVNKYAPGQGIPPHVDTHSAFTDSILSLSLAGAVTMEFRNPDTRQHVNVHLPARSLLIMSDECRYGWTHGITPRMTDIIRTDAGGLTVEKRRPRVSFTFRRLQLTECNCQYPTLCDTHQANKKKMASECPIKDNPSLLELENVHKVYDEIANHFSETRHSPWPKVEAFVNSFQLGEILVDIGCGNGKYLNCNKQIVKIGCDRSLGLLKVCRQRKLNTFQCDCLQVPIRSNSVDGCISIAVIHHLATEDRRRQAISEMLRILVPGGRGLIYVWAKDQQLQNQKSSYLRQNRKNNKSNETIQIDTNEIQFVDGLPVHTNRTQFIHQDVLVPWKRKGEDSTAAVTANTPLQDDQFLRFYHVFNADELKQLCLSMSNEIKILQSYYDQGNWCIEFQK